MKSRWFRPIAAGFLLAGLVGQAAAQGFRPPTPPPPPPPVYRPPPPPPPSPPVYRPPPPPPPSPPVYRPPPTFTPPFQQMNQMRNDRAIQDIQRTNYQTQQILNQQQQTINRTLDQNRQFSDQMARVRDQSQFAANQAARDRDLQNAQRFASQSSRRSDGTTVPAAPLGAVGARPARNVAAVAPPAAPPRVVPAQAPDERAASRYDLAMQLAECGKVEKARERCAEIVADHPGTRGARLAREYLEKTGGDVPGE